MTVGTAAARAFYQAVREAMEGTGVAESEIDGLLAMAAEYGFDRDVATLFIKWAQDSIELRSRGEHLLVALGLGATLELEQLGEPPADMVCIPNDALDFVRGYACGTAPRGGVPVIDVEVLRADIWADAFRACAVALEPVMDEGESSDPLRPPSGPVVRLWKRHGRVEVWSAGS
jgi:hypothetical protein